MHEEYAIIRDALDKLTSTRTIQELALKVPKNSIF
jgi:hypothetical protein